MSAVPLTPWRQHQQGPSMQPMNAMNTMNAMNPFTKMSNMNQAPAYTAVQGVRQSFDRRDVVSASSTQSQPQDRPKQVWPDTVRAYVQRCFAEQNNIPGVERQEMEIKLKQIITQAAEKNQLSNIDWENTLLPQQIIQAERNQQYTMTMSTLNQNLSNPQTNMLSNGSTPRKRKSDEFSHNVSTADNTSSIPPWRTTNHTATRDGHHSDKRMRFDNQPKTKGTLALEKRKQRFDTMNAAPLPYISSGEQSPMPGVKQGPIVGRCETLEKRYFRLTAPPNPETVRPFHVLEKTLDLLKDKWRKDNNYGYICDQFKSLRQDLTVQHIRTEFTVTVYEIHARIALEKGDLGEYNQCQTQLRALYALNLGGHPTEFKAYRILYFLYTTNKTDMNDALADLTTADRSAPTVKHALEARSALALGNYHRFFKLYLETPKMGAYLMDMFVGRERMSALVNLAKAYKPDVKLRFVTEELGFESDEEAARFICEHGGQAFLEEKDGEVRLLTGKSAATFESVLKASFQKVDLKGQI